MRVIDLTHPIHSGMPVYPGTPPPQFHRVSRVETEGFTEHGLTFTTHTGTHLDAPAHMLSGAATLDRLDPQNFVGPGIVLDVTAGGKTQVEVDDLVPRPEGLRGKDFVLLHSGWSRHWGSPAYFSGYPVLSDGAARWLADMGLKGVGVDMISVDAPDASDYPIHKILLRQGVILIENLQNLSALQGLAFTFVCLPLNVHNADGCPVRAVALPV